MISVGMRYLIKLFFILFFVVNINCVSAEGDFSPRTVQSGSTNEVKRLNLQLSRTNECSEIRGILVNLANLQAHDSDRQKNYQSKSRIPVCDDLLTSLNKNKKIKRYAVQVFSGHSENKAMIAKYTLRDQGFEQAFHVAEKVGDNIVNYRVYSGEYLTHGNAENIIKRIKSKKPLMKYGKPYIKVKG